MHTTQVIYTQFSMLYLYLYFILFYFILFYFIGIIEHFEISQYFLEKNIGPKQMLIAPLFDKTLVVQ